MLASFFRGTQTVRDKCYVMQWGGGSAARGGKGCPLSQKKKTLRRCAVQRYKRYVVLDGGQISRIKRYVTLPRPRRRRIRHSCCMCGTVNRHNFGRSARVIFFLSNNQCSVHGTFFNRLIWGLWVRFNHFSTTGLLRCDH